MGARCSCCCPSADSGMQVKALKKTMNKNTSKKGELQFHRKDKSFKSSRFEVQNSFLLAIGKSVAKIIVLFYS